MSTTYSCTLNLKATTVTLCEYKFFGENEGEFDFHVQTLFHEGLIGIEHVNNNSQFNEKYPNDQLGRVCACLEWKGHQFLREYEHQERVLELLQSIRDLLAIRG